MALEPCADRHRHGPVVGDVRDQAHLHGLLHRLRGVGNELVAIEPASPADASR